MLSYNSLNISSINCKFQLVKEDVSNARITLNVLKEIIGD